MQISKRCRSVAAINQVNIIRICLTVKGSCVFPCCRRRRSTRRRRRRRRRRLPLPITRHSGKWKTRFPPR